MSTKKPHLRRFFRVSAVASYILISMAALTQTRGPIKPPKELPTPQVKIGEEIKVDVDLTLVNVTVTDPLDRLVTGFEKEHFRVYEDGVEQEILSLSSEHVPLSIRFLFAITGNMPAKVQNPPQPPRH